MNFYHVAAFVGLSLIFFTVSCKTSRYVITVTNGDTTTQRLVLKRKDGSAADTINVREGDKVLWRIKTKSVLAITEIADKNSITQPAFLTNHEPHKKSLSRTWVTKVNSVSKAEFDSVGYVKEYYFIKWKPKGPDSTKTFDPLMKIYPKKP